MTRCLVVTIHQANVMKITSSTANRALLCGSSTQTSGTVTAVSPRQRDGAARSSSRAARPGTLDQKIDPLCPPDYLAGAPGPGGRCCGQRGAEAQPVQRVTWMLITGPPGRCSRYWG